MNKGRLEAFSDGVIAILITIMVLEFKVPKGNDLAALRPLLSLFLAYVLSFTFLGIYWTNHHHLLHATHRINGKILWANLHLLFWLSLTPFVTAWVGENPAAPLPIAVSGVVLFLAAVAYWILSHVIVDAQGPTSTLALAVGRDVKGKVSAALNLVAIPMAFVRTWMSIAIFVTVALIWLVPDRRIESRLNQ